MAKVKSIIYFGNLNLLLEQHIEESVEFTWAGLPEAESYYGRVIYLLLSSYRSNIYWKALVPVHSTPLSVQGQQLDGDELLDQSSSEEPCELCRPHHCFSVIITHSTGPHLRQ